MSFLIAPCFSSHITSCKMAIAKHVPLFLLRASCSSSWSFAIRRKLALEIKAISTVANVDGCKCGIASIWAGKNENSCLVGCACPPAVCETSCVIAWYVVLCSPSAYC